jgi:hypothetical protein
LLYAARHQFETFIPMAQGQMITAEYPPIDISSKYFFGLVRPASKFQESRLHSL